MKFRASSAGWLKLSRVEFVWTFLFYSAGKKGMSTQNRFRRALSQPVEVEINIALSADFSCNAVWYPVPDTRYYLPATRSCANPRHLGFAEAAARHDESPFSLYLARCSVQGAFQGARAWMTLPPLFPLCRAFINEA